MRTRTEDLETQKAELMAKFIEVPHDVPAILPSTSRVYSKKVERPVWRIRHSPELD
jgi:hypothetical protein